MDYEYELNKYCPPYIISEAKNVDFYSDYSDFLSNKVDKALLLPKCKKLLIIFFAKRISKNTDINSFSEFLSLCYNNYDIISGESKDVIRDAIIRGPYNSSIAFNYFNAIRVNSIDIRKELDGVIYEDWSFDNPRSINSETWHYYMYLASFGDERAMQLISDKISNTENGNDVMNLLISLSNLNSEFTYKLINVYRDDPRRADGPDGPSISIGEWVEINAMINHR